MKKVGTIGGSGFIGTYNTQKFLNEGYKVKVSTTDLSKKEKYEHFILIYCQNYFNHNGRLLFLKKNDMKINKPKRLFDRIFFQIISRTCHIFLRYFCLFVVQHQKKILTHTRLLFGIHHLLLVLNLDAYHTIFFIWDSQAIGVVSCLFFNKNNYVHL